MDQVSTIDGKRTFRQWLSSTGYTDRCRSTNSYTSLSRHEQMNFCRQMTNIACEEQVRKTTHSIPHDALLFIHLHRNFRDDEMMILSLTDAYSRAEHWSVKRQLLSIVAADLPSYVLKSEFTGLTDWKIKQARKHAFFSG